MIIPLQISTMSLLVILLVVSLASQCWTAPQRRNWTPQAILYLKGARKSTLIANNDECWSFTEGHRSPYAWRLFLFLLLKSKT
uniref:Secreted protein n=1 Tax=Amphiprion percula TaxID=161767 RepID=A0A3P8RWJ8_AMPPE